MFYLYFLLVLVFAVAIITLLVSLSRRPVGREILEFKFGWKTIYNVVAFWVLIFILGFFVTRIQTLGAVDGQILRYFFTPRGDVMTVIMNFMSNLFEFTNVLVVLAGVMLWLIINKKWSTMLTWIITVAGSAGSMFVVKHIVMRERPFIGWQLISENGYSYFSGHSVTAMAVIGLAVWLITKKYSLSGWSKLATWVVGLLIILAIGFSRLYLGAHYPIDVLFDMVLEGYDTFAFVKNSVIHLTHSRGIVEFFKRRIRFVNKYHLFYKIIMI